MRRAPNAGIIASIGLFLRDFLLCFAFDDLSSMDTPVRVPKSDSRARCPRCGVAFDCAGASQPLRCWCADMPALPASAGSTGAACLCPACYADALAASRSAGAAPDHPLP